jgi:hypothetical protein
MARQLAYVFTSLLALASPALAGSEVPHAPGVEVLVNGVPQPRYAHARRWYVEAVKGREYAIRLRNPYPVRVAVALSVDGLNTIDARDTTSGDARKWVLGPYQTVTISGWQTTRSDARRFEFTTEERSYGQALGKTANLGIISAVFYKERVPQLSRNLEPQRPASPPAQPTETGSADARSAAPSAARKAEVDEYAATGMGRRTDHPVEQVWLDLEDTPAASVDIRYEFRPQLARLGILPPAPPPDPLRRREGARGFEPGFAPDPDVVRR